MAASKPKTYDDVLWQIMTADLGVARSMARVVAWAKKDREVKKAEIWRTVPDVDFSEAVEKVGKWTVEALKKLPKAPKVDIVSILLGDCPECFWVQAYPYSRGRDAMTEFVPVLRKRRYLVEEDWDHLVDLLYKQVKLLPGKIWKLGPFNSDKIENEVHPDSARMIWEAVATLGFADGLRSGRLDFAKLLGKRKVIPVLLGYTEMPHFIGTLTPEGWDTRR